ncbi:unnamed protein product [Ambrosiozyma monospora]|uniref:Unnamed protein product n=1 Tax=Ambrosiozyma monospora TaxID=43982 RepID=A0A9W6SWE6_AMBMO|nr:unnamed protein product [Ambrosiozyma monospora]
MDKDMDIDMDIDMVIPPTQAKRVKVYTLEGDKWIDRGTGLCSGELIPIEKTEQSSSSQQRQQRQNKNQNQNQSQNHEGDDQRSRQKPHFIVREEDNESEIILNAIIEGTTQYQRQQDTLIVWSDNEGNDYALSFQEPEGCLELCEFLIKVQHSIEPNISLVAVFCRIC